MRRIRAIATCVLALSLTGCGAVGGAVITSLQIAGAAADLGVKATQHSVTAARTGVEIAKGALDVAGGAVQLVDQVGEAGHRAKMREVQYGRAVAQAK